MDIVTLVLFFLSLFTATLAYGGMLEPYWSGSAAFLGMAGALAFATKSKRSRVPSAGVLSWLLLLFVLFVAFQATSLPVGVIQKLSPARMPSLTDWTWAPLAESATRTVQYVGVAAAAAVTLLLGRQIGWRLRRSGWLGAAPVLAVTAFQAALGLFQFLTMREELMRAQPVKGTYLNRNHFAGLMEMVVPLALCWAISLWTGSDDRGTHTSRRGRAGTRAGAVLGLAAVMTLASVVSLSRMGFIATIIGAMVTGLLALPPKRRALGTAALVVVALAAFIVLPTAEWINRWQNFSESEGLTGDAREQIWRETIPLAKDYWLTGAGLGGYIIAFLRYKTVGPMHTVDFAHNDYLQTFTELGIFGFTIGLAIVGICLWKTWQGTKDSWLAVGCFAGMFAMLIHSIVDFNMYIHSNMLVAAWLLGLGSIRKEAISSKVGRSERTRIAVPQP